MVQTTEAKAWEGAKFHCFHSRDLETWSEPAEILDVTENISWANKYAWAPSLVKKDGYWYFVFVAEHQIGIAVCDTPMGTYRDVLDRPLIAGGSYEGVYTIDPSLFTDIDGRTYLLFGNGKAIISEIFLSPTDVHLVGEATCLSDDFFWQRSLDNNCRDFSVYTEAPDLIRIGNRYLLTWSCYDTRDSRYCIRYAWSQRATGPYIQPLDEEHENILIQRKGEIQCTGHGNIFEKDGDLYLAYHRFALPRDDYHREVCCDKVEFEDDLHLFVTPTR
jgi:beta-xylosidase